jgi:hypothetical protein
MKDTDFEKQLRSIASGMDYPPNPDIAGSVAARLRGPHRRSMSRSTVRILVAVVILLASLLILPPVRAAVLEFIQVGAVRIFRTEPMPAPPPTQFPSTMVPVTATPAVTPALPSLIPLLENMAGESTLSNARQTVDYPILLPTYPAEIGEPDRVFIQEADGPIIILVWMDPQLPDHVKMSLHFIPEGSWVVTKFAPRATADTSVNGQQAIWAVGPYPLMMQNGDMEISRLVAGHVLIWESDGITYRLETDLSMDEAVRVAESLKPIP